MYSLTIAVYAAGQAVYAHTGVRDQATEGTASFNGFTITHGCGSDNDPTVPSLPVIGQSAVFPYGDASSSFGPTVWVDVATNTVIPTGGTGIVSLAAPPALPIFNLSVGGIQQDDPFDIVEEETDPASPTVVRALNWQGSDVINRIKRLKSGKIRLVKKAFAGLGTDLVGIPEYRVSAPTIIDDCVSKLRVRIAVANWCEKGGNEANDPDNNRADWWFPHPVIAPGTAGAPGTGSTRFIDVDLTQDNFWTTLTVNNADPRADPTTCPGGVLREVAVQPAGTEIDTFLPFPPFTEEPAPF
ncbi:MAG: hypothetical protein ACRD1T_15935 [Acidimicrobiia bacterium]